jgi:hypothetical protein
VNSPEEVPVCLVFHALSHPAIIGLFRCQLAGTHGYDKWFLGKAKRTYLQDDGTPFPAFAEKVREANRATLKAEDAKVAPEYR